MFDWSKNPNYRLISCKVCKKCWVNIETGICIYGGPFIGYKLPNGKIVTLEKEQK